MKRDEKYFKGCILGGAIGDALGRPIELKKLKEIKATYGSKGINNLTLNDKGIAEITDDTQMTLFTAEGILRANCKKGRCYIPAVVYNAYLRWYSTQRNIAEITDDTQMTLFTAEGILRANCKKGRCYIPAVVYNAYLRWYSTQRNIDTRGYDKCTYNSYLLKYDELYEDRGAGNTCLTSLSKEEIGSIKNPINNSKGCGGVMRVAPIGLVMRVAPIGLMYNKKEAFRLGCDCAALTHGHPSGYISGGMLSCIISCIIEGMEIDESINCAISFAKDMDGYCECVETVEKAVKLSKDDLVDTDAIRMIGEGWTSDEALAIAIYSSLKYKDDFKKALICSVNHDGDLVDTDAIRMIGEGWTSDEALAIAIYSSLKYKDDFKKALICSVNHDGDSDSTGAICGNILGAYLGIDNIPKEWIDVIELKELLENISTDLLTGYEESEEWFEKYLEN